MPADWLRDDDHVREAARQHRERREGGARQQRCIGREAGELRPEDQRDAADAQNAAEADADGHRRAEEQARQGHVQQRHGRVADCHEPGDDALFGVVDEQVADEEVEQAHQRQPGMRGARQPEPMAPRDAPHEDERRRQRKAQRHADGRRRG